MGPYSDMEDELDLGSDEDGIEDGYEEAKKVLEKNSPLNANGTYRCIFCTKRCPEYNLAALLNHAEMAANSKGQNVKVEKLGQHKALVEWLQEVKKKELLARQLNAQPTTTLQPANVPVRERRKAVMLWPPAAIVANLRIHHPGSSEPSVRTAVEDRFGEFRPAEARVYFGQGATIGWAVLRFEESLKGLINAKDFTDSMERDAQGRRAWENNLERGTLGTDQYGWQAMEDDLDAPEAKRGLSPYAGLKELADLKKYSRLKQCQVLDQEDRKLSSHKKEIRDKAVSIRELKAQWRQQDKELKTKQEEHELAMAILKEEHRLAMETVMMDHQVELEDWKEQEESAKRRNKIRLKELEIRNKELEKVSATMSCEKEKVELEIAKLLKSFTQVSVQEKAAETERMNERHAAEKMKLEKQIQKLITNQATRQNKEKEVHQAEQTVQQMEVTTSGSQSEELRKAHEKLEKLHKELEDLKKELDVSQDNQTALTIMERELRDDVEEGRNAALEVFDFVKNKESKAAKIIDSVMNGVPGLPLADIRIKRVGELDIDVWRRAFLARRGGEKGRIKRGTDVEVIFSKWDKRIRDPELGIWKSVPIPQEGVDRQDWPQKMVVNEDHPQLAKLRALYPPEVAEDVIEATRLLDEYNRSGRYPRPMVWNHGEGRPATMAEVVRRLVAVVEALEDLRTGEGRGKRKKSAGKGRG